MIREEEIYVSEEMHPPGFNVIKELGEVFGPEGNDRIDSVIRKLQDQSKMRGGNAVVGFSCQNISSNGNSSIFARGYAAVIKRI